MKVFLGRQMHVAIILLSLALAGCLGGPSAPTNFYMLSPLSPSQAGTSPARRPHPYRPRNGWGCRIFESTRYRRQPGRYGLSAR